MESPLTVDYMHIDDFAYTVTTYPFSFQLICRENICTDTEHTFIKHGSGALIDWYWEYWLELRRGTAQRLESRRLLVDCARWNQENSESTVASSVAAGATAAKSATTTAESATKSYPSFVRFATVSCAKSGIGSVGRSKSSTNQSNLGGYEMFWESFHR